ncbi:hypothetical protein, partial [Escherichia coli]
TAHGGVVQGVVTSDVHTGTIAGGTAADGDIAHFCLDNSYTIAICGFPEQSGGAIQTGGIYGDISKSIPPNTGTVNRYITVSRNIPFCFGRTV